MQHLAGSRQLRRLQFVDFRANSADSPIDTFGADADVLTDFRPTPVGEALEQRFGDQAALPPLAGRIRGLRIGKRLRHDGSCHRILDSAEIRAKIQI